MKEIAGKNKLKNYQNLSKLTIFEIFEKKGIKPPKIPFTEADVRSENVTEDEREFKPPKISNLERLTPKPERESESKAPVKQAPVKQRRRAIIVTKLQLTKELQSLGIKVKSSWDKAELIRQLAISKQERVETPKPETINLSPWDTEPSPSSPGERKREVFG